tara:strand:+ start:7523 stop:8476 length:954 start_codon:yes stop_codon:yes gene_type:complete
MKFLESHYDHYITNIKKKNIHRKLEKYYNCLPKDITSLKNIIFYGPKGSGKYSQSLYLIERYSSSNLKYEKKMNIEFTSNKDLHYDFKISDVHYEIDLELLGCNSKNIWHDFFINTLDVISTKENKTGIILCKNFHMIHNELIDIFYSYMQSKNNLLNVIFILITEQISFIPNNIIECCNVIYVPKPSACQMKTIGAFKTIHYDNLKSKKLNIVNKYTTEKDYCDEIYLHIVNIKELSYSKLRVLLYNLLIYNYDIYNCIEYIVGKLIKHNAFKNSAQIEDLIINTHMFFKYYNNNYRPIYHLENYILYLIIKVNEL